MKKYCILVTRATIKKIQHTSYVLLSQLRWPRSNDIPEVKTQPEPRSCFLMPFSNKGNQGSLEQLLILGQGKGIYKMSLEQVVVQERKCLQSTHTNEGACHKSQLKELPIAIAGTIRTTK